MSSRWPFRVTPPLVDVVNVLLTCDTKIHGWAIAEQCERRPSTVYRALERLRLANWVTYEWEREPPPGTPRRRFYRLTDGGRAQAPELLAERGGVAQQARSTTDRCRMPRTRSRTR